MSIDLDFRPASYFDFDACTDFASVESEIYPELATWYEQRAEAWLTARRNR